MTASSSSSIPTPERATIGGSLEIPRMINGLWQLAGGHDENVDITAAAEAMKPLYVICLRFAQVAQNVGWVLTDSEICTGPMPD